MKAVTLNFLLLVMFLSSGLLFSQTRNILIVGDIEGHVYNGGGNTIAGATIGVDGWAQTTSGATGYYLLSGIPEGDNDVVCFKEGYNMVTEVVNVPSGGIVTHDFTLTQPIITISPLFFSETLNPNEYYTDYLGILNMGDGDGNWTAVVNYISPSSAPGSQDITQVQVRNFSNVDYTGANITTIPGGNGEPLNSRSGFDCPDGSVFSYPAVSSDNGYSSDASNGLLCYQSFSGVTESFTTVTVWAIHTSAPSGSRELLVEVYGPGSTPGTLESSTIAMVDPINTGIPVIGYDTYSYTIDIPTSSLTSGWISVQATAGGSPTWYWLNTYATPTYPAMQNTSVLPAGLAMCLSSTALNWLTLDEYEGTVLPNGGLHNVPVNFDATGTVAGEVYTAEIVITTDPDVGTFTIPVTMTIFGDPLYAVTDLEVELVNMITGQVGLDWSLSFIYPYPPSFQYFIVERDGVVIGTTTDLFFTDFPPSYGTYCYTVIPVFSEGNGVGATNCVEWVIPEFCWSPSTVYNEQWIDHQEEVNLTLESCGSGTLQFMFPDYISSSRFACDMQIALYDSYGDGWNGGSLDVFVNGNLVLDDITLASGSGPEYFSFPVEGGDDISTVYTAGQWPYENSYEFYDGDGNLIYTSPYNNLNLAEGTVFGICPQPGYIIDVEPATGIIPSGETMDVTITYDATGFPVGLYDEWLKIETNDPLHLEDSIFNQMLVYLPGMFYGYVHDCNTGLPLLGVTVSTYYYTATTNDNGYYEMYVDADTYDIEFSLLGYETMMVIDSYVSGGGMTEVSICMNETPYPVSWVLAEPDTLYTGFHICHVSWGLPMGPYEIIYDDGEADDFVVWTEPGHMAGVKFTPVGYPATIIGGRFNVGDGTFPSGSNFLGSDMVILVMDDDGANGLPGTVLDSDTVYVDNYGWVDFYGLFDATIEDGEFFIVLLQPGYSINSAPLAVDTDPPTVYRSYAKLVNGSWSISPYQDFMIRAYVDGPNAGVVSCSSSGKNVKIPKVSEGPFLATNLPNVKDGVVKDGEIRQIEGIDTTRDLDHYVIARVTDFDPDLGPETGVLTPFANIYTGVQYITDIAVPQEGFYAYAITTMYTSGQSEWIYSNIVSNGLDNEVTIVVSLCNDGELENSEVTLVGHDYPYDMFQGVTDTNGIVVFDSVIDGSYDLFVSKVGYNTYGGYMQNNTYYITTDTTIGVELIQKMYPPQNLYVDPLTSVATWDEPLITQLYLEDFEDPAFPPDGWQATTIDAGWFRSDDAGYGAWYIPPGDGFYAVTNDDLMGSTSSAEDYLITPMVDLRESEDFALYFSSFYDGAYGFSASIEYSYDNGVNWEILEYVSPDGVWVDVSVDLSSLSGSNSLPVWLAFHGDDHMEWSSGWAVDNVEVKNGPAPVLAYDVFLNNEFYAQTTAGETTYTFVDLIYGETYESCVFAIYDCGASDPICTTWESIYIQPPRNLTDEYTYGTNEVLLMWNPPIKETNVPEGLVSFNLYRDSVNIAIIPYEGQGVDDWITYVDNNLDPNPYVYYVSAEYDLDIFGYPGEFAESAWNGPDTVDVVWGTMIPFFEGWDNGTFSFQNWTFNENSENWAINSQQGEPEPSAEFTWDPLLEDGYSSTLTSYPIIVDYLTEGDLFLSFDLKLEDRNSTGDEKMLIEIYDGNTWHLAAEFSNSGKFSFTTNIINITDYTSGNAINIRFNATGQNSFDIVSWFIDNIYIYRECEAPTDLTGEPKWNPVTDEPFIEICWDAQSVLVSGSNNNSIVNEKMNEALLVVDNPVNRSVTGFNIYRMADNMSEYELYDVADFVVGQTSYCYNDEYPNIAIGTGYFYQVTASYTSETDTCESAPAMAYEILTDDFVYVLIGGIVDLNASLTNIYPNPAQDMVTVTSSIPMEELTITNYVGQVVYYNKLKEITSIELNTSSFKAGVYLVKVKTENNVVTKRVIISR